MKTYKNESGFALLTAMILGLVFAAVLAGLFELSRALGKSTTLYNEASSGETLNRSAANVAAEVVKSVILDRKTPAGSYIMDADLITHDLTPNAAADMTDEPLTAPDMVIQSNGWTSSIDIDYLPLASGYSWSDIEFGSAYHKSSAGSSSMGAQTYKIHTITVGPGNKRIESDGVYVLKMK